MPGIESNPLAVLTFIAAPAILTNASSVLALGTSNRFARNVDRARQIMNSLRAGTDPNSDAMKLMLVQLGRTERRTEFLIRALSSFYFSLGCFAAGSLTSLLGAILSTTTHVLVLRVLLSIALFTGILGLSGLFIGCTVLI